MSSYMVMNRTGYRGLSTEKRMIKEQAAESMKKIRLHHFEEEERANESKKKHNKAEKEIPKSWELQSCWWKKIYVEKKHKQQSCTPNKKVRLINNSKERKNENSKQNNTYKKILKSWELQSCWWFLTKMWFWERKAISKTQRIWVTEAKKTNANLDEYFWPGLEQSIITSDNISQFVSHFSNQKKIEKYNASDNNHKKENSWYKKNDESEPNMQINNRVIEDNIVNQDIVKTPKEKNQTTESKNYLVEQKKNITEKMNYRNSSQRYILRFIISIVILWIIVWFLNS